MTNVIDFRPILFVAGMLLTALAVAMLIPTIAEASAGDQDWLIFLTSAAVTLFIGIGLILANYQDTLELSIREAFLLTTTSWVIVAAFAALPFAFSDLGLSYTDAFFEAMSGITTTGATVLIGLDDAPAGILIWRGLLEWLGGVGIIVVALAILPFLQVSGMQLFHTEFSDRTEKVLPRVTQIAAAIGAIYLLLSVICFLALWTTGMTAFDAFAHALTTISTGGFSTSDESIGHFASAEVEVVIILFMIVGSLPFALYLDVVRGRPRALWRDSQVRAFAGVLLTGTVLLIGVAVAGERLGLRGGATLIDLQCRLDHYGHRICHSRLRAVGWLRAGRVLFLYVSWRLRRIHILRHQDVSFSGVVCDRERPDAATVAPAWRVHSPLQPSPHSRHRQQRGYVVLFLVSRDLCRFDLGSDCAGSRLHHQRVECGGRDYQCRPGAWPHRGARWQLRRISRSCKMAFGRRHAAGSSRTAHRFGVVHAPFLASLSCGLRFTAAPPTNQGGNIVLNCKQSRDQ